MTRGGSTSGGNAPVGSGNSSASGESTVGFTPAAETRSRRGPKIDSLERAIGPLGVRGLAFGPGEDGAATVAGEADGATAASAGAGATAAGEAGAGAEAAV